MLIAAALSKRPAQLPLRKHLLPAWQCCQGATGVLLSWGHQLVALSLPYQRQGRAFTPSTCNPETPCCEQRHTQRELLMTWAAS